MIFFTNPWEYAYPRLRTATLGIFYTKDFSDLFQALLLNIYMLNNQGIETYSCTKGVGHK